MGVLARIILNGGWRTAVRISFANHRVYIATLDGFIGSANFFLLFSLRIIRKLWQVIAFSIEFSNGRLYLRYRGANIRCFDDIGARLKH